MKEPKAKPRIKHYPPCDPAFAATVDESVDAVAGRPITDEGILAAVQALVRTTYPLAIVRARRDAASDAASWDVFREASVLDEEMVLRARDGDRQAAEDLFDRHYPLAYGVAFTVAGQSHVAAAGAVVSAFRSMFADRQADWSVRIRLATASCDAAIEAAPDKPPSRSDMARAVVELAHVHSLSVAEIETVLRLGRHQVAALAIEGLRNSSRSDRSPDNPGR